MMCSLCIPASALGFHTIRWILEAVLLAPFSHVWDDGIQLGRNADLVTEKERNAIKFVAL